METPIKIALELLNHGQCDILYSLLKDMQSENEYADAPPSDEIEEIDCAVLRVMRYKRELNGEACKLLAIETMLGMK